MPILETLYGVERQRHPHDFQAFVEFIVFLLLAWVVVSIILLWLIGLTLKLIFAEIGSCLSGCGCATVAAAGMVYPVYVRIRWFMPMVFS